MDPKDPRCRKALAIVRRLRKAGHEALFVGGAVRDWLLGLTPKDYDVATSARPEQVIDLFPHCRKVGAHFGVVLVVDGKIHTEVATFRADMEYTDRRRPSRVRFCSAEEDARRRDFTINGIFYDPIEDDVIDYVNGGVDLRMRVLRAIGEPQERFAEDALRLLRAIRFAARYELVVERNTRKAIRAHARLLSEISAERIRDELTLMLTGPYPARALEMMDDLGLLNAVLPEIAAMRGVEQPPEFHPEGDVFEHTLACFRAAKAPLTPSLALGLLLHDVGKPPTYEEADRIRFPRHASVGADMAEAVCRRLRLPNEQRKLVAGLVRDHMRFLDVRKMRRSTLRRFLSKAGFEEDLELHRLDCLSSNGNLDNYEFCRKALEDLRQAGEPEAPPPLVKGYDLIARGLKPGPVFKTLLRQIYDLQLEGAVPARAAALRELDRVVARMAVPPTRKTRCGKSALSRLK